MGTEKFKRIKIGIGDKPAGWDLADYVLSRFNEIDRKFVEEGIGQAAKAVECIITEGIQAAMNQYNVVKK